MSFRSELACVGPLDIMRQGKLVRLNEHADDHLAGSGRNWE